MSKRASLGVQFRERRAQFSTRISARGHGHEFAEWGMEHCSIALFIRNASQALVMAQAAMEAGVADAEKQVHQLRGQLGSWRTQLRDVRRFETEDLFMSVCRALLPSELFDNLLAQARFVREEEARDLVRQIDDVMGPQKKPQEIVTMQTRDHARRRREAYRS